MYSVEISNVSKTYRNVTARKKTLKEIFVQRKLDKVENQIEPVVLKNIDIKIKKGETVALVGRNGSGKSTLLKLISKILYPDKGEVKVTGKVSSLLELGAGFHPEFTGLENIYLNATILGYSKEEINSKLNDIIEFSELKSYIYKPVKIYSSGMYMRLAFSIAINVEPDLLLIDEILSVGDAAFQTKCIEKIKQLQSLGTTIVIVSHDNGTIERLCHRAIWIELGEIKEDGNVKEVVLKYMNKLNKGNESHQIQEESITNEQFGNGSVKITDIYLYDSENVQINKFSSSERIRIQFQYKVTDFPTSIVFGFAVYTKNRECIYGTNTLIEQVPVILGEYGRVEIKIPELNLLQGLYEIDIAAHHENGAPYHYIKSAVEFSVFSNTAEHGMFKINHEWQVTSNEKVGKL
ncbi:hypothetical protein SY83_13115 [Paenibacillus swuensis]|uniref:ABC transporter domain-containing protein n=1 Tax=Paenibacillus swuensis TaxID=1178515 RepID=A0A172TJ63_9BACL|nr:ABC transporter ATP-binding protein [Paenibacillus swuensis]ANE47050.1 hypothetical protein SY83_13115 [Paenibacillus swuensis]